MALTGIELLQLLVKTAPAPDLAAQRHGFVQIMAAILQAQSVQLMGVDHTLKFLAPLAGWPQMRADLPSFSLEEKNETAKLMLWALNAKDFQIESGAEGSQPQGDFLLKSLKKIIFGTHMPDKTSLQRFALIPVPKMDENKTQAAHLIFFALIGEAAISPQTIAMSALYAHYCESINSLLLDLDQQRGDAQQLSRSLILADQDRSRMKATLPEMLSERLVGRSKPMQLLRENIARFAPSDLPIFIHGETGTGKELVAREIHRLSSRRHNNFVAINVTALPKGLEESELFGFVKGAFTGADRNRKGYFAQASGGTLFFDEIGDMALDLQAKILRVLQEKTFRPLGSNEEISSDFRLISATHRPIETMVHEGSFREDLYYRLTTFTLDIPPLSERMDDIFDITDYFLRQIAEQHQMKPKKLSDQARRLLASFTFPGNVRQLQALLLRTLYLSDDSATIESHHLVSAAHNRNSRPVPSQHLDRQGAHEGLKAAMETYERDVLLHAYHQHNGQRAKMAQQLKIPLRTLADKMKKYALEGKKHGSAQQNDPASPHHHMEHGILP